MLQRSSNNLAKNFNKKYPKILERSYTRSCKISFKRMPVRYCKIFSQEILKYLTKILYNILHDLTFTRIGVRFFNVNQKKRFFDFVINVPVR